MKLRLLALGLVMSLMTSPSGVGGSVSSSIIYTNRFIESLPDMLESDIKLDYYSRNPSTPINKWVKGWNYVEIPFYLSGFTSSERSTIRSAIYSVHYDTCIWFREVTLLTALKTRPYLHIYPGVGCWSYLGWQWAKNPQYVSLSRYGCLTRSIIQHIMMHVLGFTHEQSRPDRDKYVYVDMDDIDTKKRHFFGKYGSANQVTDYDYNSIMHYDNNAYSKSSGRWTLHSRNSSSQSFGRAFRMSSLDRQKINRFYECRSSRHATNQSALPSSSKVLLNVTSLRSGVDVSWPGQHTAMFHSFAFLTVTGAAVSLT